VYNAGKQNVRVVLKAPQGEYSVWDTIHDQFLEKSPKNGDFEVEVPADDALVLVFVPSGTTLASGHSKLTADGVVIDYTYEASPK